MLTLTAIVLGFVLDLFLGDPHWLPHPICLVGKLIAYLEQKLRPLCALSCGKLMAAGGLLAGIVTFFCFTVPFLILHLATSVHPYLRLLLETLMCYQLFATKSLRDESMKVYTALKAADLDAARWQLSRIVGRDTAELSQEEVVKAAVETVAENTADGVVAPMFYMFLGGAPLAFLYKGINTMDSMLGYRNDKYLYFGRCAARLDDLANLIPARLTAFVMMLAAVANGNDGPGAWKIFWRDRYHHLSPNSAMTESVVAGALGIELGGDHYYFGKLVHKATLGDALRSAMPADICTANELLYLTALLCLTFMTIFYYGLKVQLYV